MSLTESLLHARDRPTLSEEHNTLETDLIKNNSELDMDKIDLDTFVDENPLSPLSTTIVTKIDHDIRAIVAMVTIDSFLPVAND
jgi:hypothetical protein